MSTLTKDIQHAYEPRGACQQVFECRDPDVLLSGPAGTGKSRACLEKLMLMALLNPGMRGLIVRKTASSLTSSALDTWRKHVVPEATAAGLVKFYGGSAQEPSQYRFQNGSSIHIGGMDKASKIMSTEYDVIYVQEAIELTVNDWEALSTRLRNGVVSFQQLLADTNPDHPTHWLKQRCDSGLTTMLESSHTDNPRLYSMKTGETGSLSGFGENANFDRNTYSLTEYGAVYMQRLDALTGVRKERLRYGRWVAAEGMIYEEFQPSIHIIDPFDIPEEWTRYWAIDFGYTNPFVCQWWAEDGDGRLYLYRESYHSQKTVDVHARYILKQVTDADGVWTEPRPQAIICDHDAEGRAVLERELGLSTSNAIKGVSDGIQSVQQRLRLQGDGKPRLYLMRGARRHKPDQLLIENMKPTSTIEEVTGYVWDPGKKAGEQPLKANDHGCDAMRYMVAERDLFTGQGYRVVNF